MFSNRQKWSKWLGMLLLMMVLFAACQPPPSQETLTPPFPTAGVTVISAAEQPAISTPVVSTQPAEFEQTEIANLPVMETPALPGDPVGIQATTPPATPTSVNPLLRDRSIPRARQATMKINSPGPYSRVSSPINLEALISPTEDRMVYLNVVGEDGRSIVSQILDFRTYDALRFNISQKIPFQINSASEYARIELSVRDQFDQLAQMVSVEVILIQYGESDETLSDIEFEPYLVSSPGEGSLIKGGVLVVEGAARLVVDSPLKVELVDEKGRVVGSAETQVSPPSAGSSHMPFQVAVPYVVEDRTRIRLTLRQESTSRIPGTVWLTSSVIFLDP